jgi:rhodanese-related sulfurtransferase
MQFFLDPTNAVLIVAALVSGGLLLWPLARARAAGPTVSTLQATQLINSRHAQVVDVRDGAAFAAGSLPNARNIPVDAIDTRAGELKKDRPVIVVCQDGRSSTRAAARLRAQGFAEVFILDGGLAGWRDAGLPVRA